jgi:hypothetical protein
VKQLDIDFESTQIQQIPEWRNVDATTEIPLIEDSKRRDSSTVRLGLKMLCVGSLCVSGVMAANAWTMYKSEQEILEMPSTKMTKEFADIRHEDAENLARQGEVFLGISGTSSLLLLATYIKRRHS